MQKILGELLGVEFLLIEDVRPTNELRLQLTNLDTHEVILDEVFVDTPLRHSIKLAAHKAWHEEMFRHNDWGLPERIAEALGYGGGSE